jgi:hypothetical protein
MYVIVGCEENEEVSTLFPSERERERERES